MPVPCTRIDETHSTATRSSHSDTRTAHCRIEKSCRFGHTAVCAEAQNLPRGMPSPRPAALTFKSDWRCRRSPTHDKHAPLVKSRSLLCDAVVIISLAVAAVFALPALRSLRRQVPGRRLEVPDPRKDVPREGALLGGRTGVDAALRGPLRRLGRARQARAGGSTAIRAPAAGAVGECCSGPFGSDGPRTPLRPSNAPQVHCPMTVG